MAFSVAVIALSAKMAKADGIVTEQEIDAFRRSSPFRRKRRANVARLYNLAKQDVAGYEAYAEKLSDSAAPAMPIARCWKTCSTAYSTSPRPMARSTRRNCTS